MGLLIDGSWHDKWYDTDKNEGQFKRQEAGFRDWVTADGSSGFQAEVGRYHLYVSYACPWAHRTLIFRNLKGLQDVISVSVVNPRMGKNGWEFGGFSGATADQVNGATYLHEVYTKAKPDLTGRVTVPVLWDKKTGTIVSNESAEIIRMLNGAFDRVGGDATVDFWPPDLRDEIEAINRPIYDNVNNGVYRAGFATRQAAYDAAYDDLFATLDMLEARLAGQRYLVGDRLTEADWRLFTTLVRFDPVYHGHFKCNRQRLNEFPNIWNYLLELYQVPGVAETVQLDHIKTHYYWSHDMINPTRIVPAGPAIDYLARHDRGRLNRAA
jgi:glutathionyl-hydroquinone reductase